VCVGVGRDGASSRLYVAPQPARQHPHRTQSSYLYKPVQVPVQVTHNNEASVRVLPQDGLG
jgi:hypothetical protein